uniref:Uncharacterized protein n=1 Tax=virus sp. ctrcb4 TaxID=2825824 RepID=A0A8S5RPI7_9VIRU|nr:MAG TPA: hypothetical protein [virus sp. ctrcb4]
MPFLAPATVTNASPLIQAVSRFLKDPPSSQKSLLERIPRTLLILSATIPSILFNLPHSRFSLLVREVLL